MGHTRDHNKMKKVVSFLFVLAVICSQATAASNCTIEAVDSCKLAGKVGSCEYLNSLVACYQFLDCSGKVVDLAKKDCFDSSCSFCSSQLYIGPSIFVILISSLLSLFF
eukprot:c36840_g1_i1.p1 GENE.c36840_g1_i1~~c36840_g1_i1.p1  ORF type:complete len:109 (+),score=35.38 c36840_g1_i1:1-327(+)